MAHQATMNGHRPAVDAGGQTFEGIASGLGAFGTNLASLAALQAQLAAHDFRDSLSRAAPWLATLLATFLIVSAAVVIGMLGLADWLLTRSLADGIGQARLYVCLGGLILGALLATLAVARLRKSFNAFRRSQDELQRNVAWIRTVLAHSGR